jgi:alpha-L-fucosidase
MFYDTNVTYKHPRSFSTRWWISSAATAWMAVNSEAIHGTRPWKIFGTGPSTQVAAGPMNERNRKPLTADDVRFTAKGKSLYAFAMGWPEREAVLAPLGFSSPQAPGKIVNVELLGHEGRVPWQQDAAGLRVQMPVEKPCDYAVALKATLA